MKNLFLILLSAGFLIAGPTLLLASSATTNELETTIDQLKPKTKKLKMKSSVQCEQCRQRIMKGFADVDGVESVKVDLTTQYVTVQYDDKKISAEEIRKKLSNIGYAADDVPADASAYKALPACCQVGGMDKE